MTAPDHLQFLTSGASSEQLMAAAVANELAWLQRAAAASGGTAGADGGLHWTMTERPRSEAVVVFTEAPGPGTAAAVERVLRDCRRRGVAHVEFWSFDDADTPRLGPLLGARGCRWGGEPHWMAMDLHAGPPPQAPADRELDIVQPADAGGRVVPELPCLHPETGPVRFAMAAARPQRVWLLLALAGGEPVGQSTVNATTGDLGVCGLYETEILPSARTRGLGLDRFDRIRRFVLDLGCRYLVTDAAETAGTLYRLMGFETLRHGRTWGLRLTGLPDEPPPRDVALAEAIGLGDLAALDASGQAHDLAGRRLPNGMTPLQFAARTARPDAAEWLLCRGADPDVLSLWELGRVEDVHALLARQPGSVNARRPRSGRTLLHVAVERDDPRLLEVLLSHGGDVTVRDTRFGADPVEWATQLRRGEILDVLRAGRDAGDAAR
jgi:Ankyrin repeat